VATHCITKAILKLQGNVLGGRGNAIDFTARGPLALLDDQERDRFDILPMATMKAGKDLDCPL
jgi:hypothetical protein